MLHKTRGQTTLIIVTQNGTVTRHYSQAHSGLKSHVITPVFTSLLNFYQSRTNWSTTYDKRMVWLLVKGNWQIQSLARLDIIIIVYRTIKALKHIKSKLKYTHAKVYTDKKLSWCWQRARRVCRSVEVNKHFGSIPSKIIKNNSEKNNEINNIY